MKNPVLMAALVMFSVVGFSCASKQGGATKPKLQTPAEKNSYMIGLDIGRSLKNMNTEIDGNALLWGIEDVLQNRKRLLTEAELMQLQQEFGKQMQEKQAAVMKQRNEKGAQNAKDGEAFLAENKKKKGVITTASGLQYMVLKEGTGPKPKATDKVKANYKGTFIDGTEFDSSLKHGNAPATFPVTGVIRGWTEALQLMSVGSKYKLFIPSDLAYGTNGAGRDIGPNMTLIFELELVSIEK
jgi:FKBP-type peptidyl-prolyl cis-trans isomerase